MLNTEQTTYIDSLRKTHPGLSDTTLRPLFMESGWPEDEITEALNRYSSTPEIAVAPPPVPPTPQATTPFTPARPVMGSAQFLQPAQASPAHLTNVVVAPPEIPKGVIHEKTPLKNISVFILVLLLIGGASAGAYYYAKENGYLGGAPLLTNENIFKTTFTKLQEINSARYGVDISVGVNPREENAQSYEEMYPRSDEEKASYKRDQDRLRDIVAIKDELSSASYRDTKNNTGKVLFPLTIPPTVTTVDPKGDSYVYTPSPSRESYTLKATFETQDAVTAIAHALNHFGTEDQEKISGKTITFTERDYISANAFKGKPTTPSLFGYFDLSDVEKYIPADFKATIHINGTVDKTTEKPLNAEFGLGAEVNFGDAQFAFDLTSIKNGTDYYGIVNKMPSLFGSYSKFKGTWFHLTEEDIQNYGYGSYMSNILTSGEDGEAKEELKQAREQIDILLQAADTHKIATIVGKPEKVKDSATKKTLTKYTLELTPGSVLPFYEDVTAKLASYENPIIKKDLATTEFLKSADAEKVLEFVKQNITINLYYDTKGFPVKLEINFRYIPSPDTTTLTEKQVNLVVTLWFSDINKPVTVTAPEKSTPIDELLTELFSMTKEELLISRQSDTVSSIQNALEEYHRWTGAYPDTLRALTTKRKDVKQKDTDTSNDASRFEYMNDRAFLDPVPNDIYTKSAFTYSSTGTTYTLEYSIKLPLFSTARKPSSLFSYVDVDIDSIGHSYYDDYDTPQIRTLKFTDGANVATEKYLSKARIDKKDSDGDTLSDLLEGYIGSDSKKVDTDADGVSDADELKTGSNPIGTGRLGGSNSDTSF